MNINAIYRSKLDPILLEEESSKLIFLRTQKTILGHIFLSLVIWIYNRAESNLIIYYSNMFLVALCCFRFIYLNKFCKNTKSALATVLTILTPFTWGVFSSIVFYNNPPGSMLSTIILLVVAGLCSGATVGLYYQPHKVISFLSLILFPLVSVVFFKEVYALCVVFFIYYVFLIHQTFVNYKEYILSLQNEIELKKTNAKMKGFFKSVNAVISVFDSDLKYTMVNEELEKILGIPADTLLGKEIGHINSDSQFVQSVRAFHKSQLSQLSKEITSYHENHRFDYLLNMNKLESGEIICVSLNMSELKKTQKELQITQQKAVEGAKMASLGVMSAGIAHEINNPLAIINSKATTLMRLIKRDQIEKNKLKELVSSIISTSDRIAKIIWGLKAFSRSGENDDFETTNLNKIFEDATSLCIEKFKLANVNLTINCQPEIYINCQSVKISQVILNILNNSYDAIENLEDKWININVSIQNTTTVIKMKDSGSGIPSEVVDKLMTPFFTTKEVGKGTGLGLSISKGIIEDHKGKFYFDSSEKNTCFVIELPLSKLETRLVCA